MPIFASPARPSPTELLLDRLVREMKALPLNSRKRGPLSTQIREIEERIDAESRL